MLLKKANQTLSIHHVLDCLVHDPRASAER
jgi:hypothetical protein